MAGQELLSILPGEQGGTLQEQVDPRQQGGVAQAGWRRQGRSRGGCPPQAMLLGVLWGMGQFTPDPLTHLALGSLQRKGC